MLPFTPQPVTTLTGWEDARNGRNPGRPSPQVLSNGGQGYRWPGTRDQYQTVSNSSDGHLLAPEKHRGQEASGVSPIPNLVRKRLCKPENASLARFWHAGQQKRVCNTLSHKICCPSELLRQSVTILNFPQSST
jgi:hypothetical protein